MFYLHQMKKITLSVCILFLFLTSMAQNKAVIKVALLMPFCAKQINTNPNHKNADLGNACREYYQGLLVAADSLKNAGYNIDITIFDTERDTVKFKKILNNDAVQNADFILGPVIKEGQMMMQNFKSKKNAFHLSPLFTFTKTKIIDPKSISAYPDLTYYADYFLQYLKNKEITGNLIIITGKDASDKALATYLKQSVKPESSLKVKTLDIAKNQDIVKLLNSDKVNNIFIACDDESQVNATLKNIADSALDYKINTFGLRKIIDFRNVNLNDWLSSNLHIITPFHVNYDDSLTKAFIQTYRDYYETEPTEFAYVGYDQFIMAISTYAKTNGTFKDLDKIKPYKLIANQYMLKEKGNNAGLQNSILHILKLENEGLKEVSW